MYNGINGAFKSIRNHTHVPPPPPYTAPGSTHVYNPDIASVLQKQVLYKSNVTTTVYFVFGGSAIDSAGRAKTLLDNFKITTVVTKNILLFLQMEAQEQHCFLVLHPKHSMLHILQKG